MFKTSHTFPIRRPRGIVLLLFTVICALPLKGCTLWEQRRNITRLEEMALLGGEALRGGTVLPIRFYAAGGAPAGPAPSSSARAPAKPGADTLPEFHLGEIVRLNDPRFSSRNGRTGLWRPADFLFGVGAGIYFLEPYDPGKMPVLFIHGAAGNPAEWKYLLEHLDRGRFQPWLAYYPAGLRLGTTAELVARSVTLLESRYGAPPLAIVAHSMGGLVARAAINRLAAAGGGGALAAFVTLSTPWGGHAAAAAGVRQSLVVVPSWNDVVPGNAFLAGLFQAPLPAQCPYYLLFSYNGRSRVLDEPNDGTVAVSSELSPEAQQAAARVYGFKEDHEGILKSAEASRMLNAILAGALEGAAP